MKLELGLYEQRPESRNCLILGKTNMNLLPDTGTKIGVSVKSKNVGLKKIAGYLYGTVR